MKATLEAKPTLHYFVCEHCKTTGYLPREMCPACGLDRYECRQSAGQGRVVALTRFNSSSAADGETQTSVCLVEMDERFQALGRCWSEASIGARVTVDRVVEHIPFFAVSE